MNSLIGMSKRVIRVFKRIFTGFIDFKKVERTWINSMSLNSPQKEITGHVLVVKNQKYAQIARICVASYLHYHPISHVVIHCDKTTFRSMKRNFKFGIHSNRVRIVCDQEDGKTWQNLKLQLILSLNGTPDFVMDADLKWNGSLGELKGVTFFVRETPFNNNDIYKALFDKLGIISRSNEFMKNTSFFSWNGITYAQEDVRYLKNLLSQIYQESKNLNVCPEEQASLIRISEQLAMSLFIKDTEATYLKESDTQFDGSFVESSYFGATGTKFGKFGITSRKF
jgi:hypothetical protein